MNNSALEILENTISEHNKNTSDLNKFAFSAREKEIFVSMMKRYAFECSKASLEKAADSAEIQESSDEDYCDYIDRLSITKTENIILL